MTTDTRVQFRCAAGRSCRDPDRDGKQLKAAPVTGPNDLCEADIGATQHALDRLGANYHRARAAVVQVGQNGNGQKVSGTPEPAIPINAHMDALACQLGHWADLAMHVIAPKLNIDHPAPWKGRGFPRRYDRIISVAEHVLPHHLDKLLGTEEGAEIAVGLSNTTRRLNGALGDPNPRRRLALPCPREDCGAHNSLGIDNGQTDVTCTACGGRWTEREYDWLSGLIVSDIQDREDQEMWEWLLAEARWQAEVGRWLVAERDWQLHHVRKITEMDFSVFPDVSGAAVVELMKEFM